jgi:hypothetical protein
MNKILVSIVFLMLIAVFVLTTPPQEEEHDYDEPYLLVSSPKISPGKRGTVSLDIKKIDNLGSFDMKISYDASKLTYLGYNQATSDFILITQHYQDQYIYILGYTMDCIYGDAKIIDLIFESNPSASGTTTIQPYDVEFLDASLQGIAIPVDIIVPGKVTIT